MLRRVEIRLQGVGVTGFIQVLRWSLLLLVYVLLQIYRMVPIVRLLSVTSVVYGLKGLYSH